MAQMGAARGAKHQQRRENAAEHEIDLPVDQVPRGCQHRDRHLNDLAETNGDQNGKAEPSQKGNQNERYAGP